MPIRYHAQRKHIIDSLNSLLSQLHTISFLLAPSLLGFFVRCAVLPQLASTRELDGSRGLRFWYMVIIFINLGSVWGHASVGVPEGRGVVLDFVGIGRKPSKAQLLLLDFTIMLLQAVLTTIAYETTITNAMLEDYIDPLLPPPSSSSEPPSPIFQSPPPPSDVPAASSSNTSIPDAMSTTYPPRAPAASSSSPSQSGSEARVPLLSTPPPSRKSKSTTLPPSVPVIDLTFRHVAHRLTSANPDLPTREGGDELLNDDLNAIQMSLPMPNTTSLRLTQILRIAQERGRRRREAERAGRSRRARNGNTSSSDTGEAGRGGRRETGGSRRIPGAIEEESEEED